MRRPKAEIDSETADPSVRSVRIADLITEHILPAVSLPVIPNCADGRPLTGAADFYAFLFIFWKG
jgi:hypothetical protein